MCTIAVLDSVGAKGQPRRSSRQTLKFRGAFVSYLRPFHSEDSNGGHHAGGGLSGEAVDASDPPSHAMMSPAARPVRR